MSEIERTIDSVLVSYCQTHLIWIKIKTQETLKEKPKAVEQVWDSWIPVQCAYHWCIWFVPEAVSRELLLFSKWPSLVWLFQTPWTLAHQAPLSSTFYWTLLKLMSIELVMLSNHHIPVAYCTPSDLWRGQGGSSSDALSFCLFILFMGFSRQEYWSGLPVPPAMDHVLSELFTMTRLSWMALHSMTHSFI